MRTLKSRFSLRTRIASLVAALLFVAVLPLFAADGAGSAAILRTVNDRLAREFISHDGLLLDYVGEIPTPEEIADLKPNAMGWWCPIENGSMFTGEWLPALMAEGPSRKSLVETCVRGLIKMSEVSDVPGFIARGTGTDGKSHHPCGSNDQTDPWVLGLCEYCRWPHADAALKAKALERVVAVAKALEANGWQVPCDGPFKGQNRGKLNATNMPFWCVTRFLYMLQSLAELTGDAHWAELYAKTKRERLDEIACGAEIDAKSFKAAYGDCVWIYLSSAQTLAGLIAREKDAADRERMRKGLSNYAAHVAPLMKNRVHYKNTTERPFKYANWRTGYAWRVQKTQKDAEAVARSGKPEILGWRKDYERIGMANPLAAAAVCALSGEAAYREEVEATLGHYDYSTPNISEFFSAAVAASALSPVLSAEAKIELGTPFADGMVLQRGMKVPVWGKAGPGHKITVSFAGQEKSVESDLLSGCWKVELDPMEASDESRALTVVEKRPGLFFDSTVDTVEIRDVLVGEVWFCSGQSNTECPIWGSNPHYRDGQGATVIQMTVKPNVRVVKMERCASATPRTGYRATWRKMTPQTLYWDGKGMPPSAMGYYYALELANALDIPIGLLDSSWGGTNIDAWTPPSGYEGLESLKDIAALPTLDEQAFVEARQNGVYKDTYGHGAWHQQPSALWNGMVAAFAPMALRGFIWYQGCHNAGEAQRYCDKMHALYNGWAKEFANPDLKLYFAQLAPYGNGWYAMDLAQAKFEREEKNAAMAIINDVGCLTDIHPNDKRTVAKRLALHALKRDYGFDWIVDNSPTLKSWKVEGDKFVLSFNDAKEWYLYNPDWSVTNGFEVCGTNGVWTAATIENLQGAEEAGRIHGNCRGQISGADLVISAKGVDEPVKLRYLFRKPWKGNLYNEFALPLGAFEVGK